MSDEEIVGLFFERSEQAIGELSRKYGRVFMRIAMNALGSKSDAEECVNDSLLAVWNAVPPENPDRLLPYAARIVRNIAVNRYKSRGFKARRLGMETPFGELSEILSSNRSPEDEACGRELAAFIDEFLAGQNEMGRMLFVRRYFFMDAIADIAKDAGMKPGAVRTRLFRIRTELKEFLQGKGVEL